MTPRPPLPPFTEESAIKKVQAAEDAWNSRDPERVSLAYTEDTEWRNRDEFLNGRAEVKAFLTRKWAKETDYRLKKTLWAFTGNRIAVRFHRATTAHACGEGLGLGRVVTVTSSSRTAPIQGYPPRRQP